MVMTTHCTDVDENNFECLSGCKRKTILYELDSDFPSALSLCRQRASNGLEVCFVWISVYIWLSVYIEELHRTLTIDM